MPLYKMLVLVNKEFSRKAIKLEYFTLQYWVAVYHTCAENNKDTK